MKRPKNLYHKKTKNKQMISTYIQNRPGGYKTFLMLNSTEHEIYLLKNVKMPAVVGILTFIRGGGAGGGGGGGGGGNSILGLSEHKKS